MIAQNLAHIREQIQQCECYSKTQSAVKLLAVSKTKPIEAILAAYEAGQTVFGENYVQEGVEKIQFCQQHQIELEWHFIGPLQSNKTRLVAEYFDWMQTLERAKIADRLNEQRSPHKAPLNAVLRWCASAQQFLASEFINKKQQPHRGKSGLQTSQKNDRT